MAPIPHLWQDVPGYADFVDYYGEIVRRAPAGSVLVEVGVGVGRSLSYLAVEAANARKGLRVIGVDNFRHENFPGVPRGRTQRQHFDACTAPIAHLFEVVEGHSRDMADFMLAGGVRPWLVFIDASHDFASVYEDCVAWWRLVRRGGVMAGDDYDMLQVRGAVHQFAGSKALSVSRINGLRGWGLWQLVKPEVA